MVQKETENDTLFYSTLVYEMKGSLCIGPAWNAHFLQRNVVQLWRRFFSMQRRGVISTYGAGLFLNSIFWNFGPLFQFYPSKAALACNWGRKGKMSNAGIKFALNLPAQPDFLQQGSVKLIAVVCKLSTTATTGCFDWVIATVKIGHQS